MWYREIANAKWDGTLNPDGSGPGPGKVVGHYSQVVWASSQDLGCALIDHPGGGSRGGCIKNSNPPQTLNCQYGPGGNDGGYATEVKPRVKTLRECEVWVPLPTPNIVPRPTPPPTPRLTPSPTPAPTTKPTPYPTPRPTPRPTPSPPNLTQAQWQRQKCIGPVKCGSSRWCLGFEGSKVYCYGKSTTCIPNDCRSDADCKKYTVKTSKWTVGDDLSCPTGGDWRWDACFCP